MVFRRTKNKLNMKLEFKLKEKSRANKVFLCVKYAGGDADTEHPNEYEYDFPSYEIDKNLHIIEKDIKEFKILEKILDVNSKEYSKSYEEIEEKYGDKIVRLYENVPNDPQTDYQTKCYIDEISVIKYDENGNKYESYIKYI
jgi:hypothetical protein